MSDPIRQRGRDGYWKPNQVERDSLAFYRFMVGVGRWLFPVGFVAFWVFYIWRLCG